MKDISKSKKQLVEELEQLRNRVEKLEKSIGRGVADERIEAERKRFNDVLEALPVYVILLDPDYRVPFANRFFRERFGESRGKRCYEYLFNRTEPCEVCDTYTVLKTNAPHRWEWVGPDGHNYDIFDFPFTDNDGGKLILEMGIDVTENKIREKALQESEFRFRSFFDLTADLVCIADINGYFRTLNPSWERTLGHTKDELLDRPFLDFIHPDDKDKTLQVIKEKLERGELVLSFENRYIRKDGGVVWLEWTSQPSVEKESTFAIARDVTERKLAEQKLRKSEASLAEAQRLAHLGNWDWNIVTNELNWSDEVYRIFGLTPQEFGATYDAFLNSVHPDDRALVTESVNDAVSRKKPYGIDHRVVLPDGAIRFVHEMGEVTFDETGKPVRMIGTVQDITERKLVEVAREKAEQELEKQRALSIQSDRLRALGEMATGIAHELNQPLAGVRGLSEHILLGMQRGWYPENKQVMEKSQLIIDQVERMTHIIEHVRGFAKGANQSDLIPIQVNDVVKSGLGLMQAQLRSRGLILQSNLADGLPSVMANPFSLEEVIFNLLSNGRDAMLEKMELEEIQHPVISLSTYLDLVEGLNKVTIKVVDQGAGIKPEVINKIFDPFFTTKGAGKGTGIGLPISKSIVESMGGSITIQSKPGMGTTAFVQLPTIG